MRFMNSGPVHLALLRIVLFVCWLLTAWLFQPSAYALLPAELFDPWGLYKIADLLPFDYLSFLLSEWFLQAIRMLLITICLLCILGIKPFLPVGLTALLLIFLFDFVIRGFNGFINHAQIGLLFATIFVVLSPAADALSVRKSEPLRRPKDSAVYGWPLFLTAMTLTLAYSFIGIRRIVRGGFDIFTNDAIIHYTLRNTLEQSPYGFQLGMAVVEILPLVLLLKAGFMLVTILEILSPFILFNNSLRRFWLWVMIPFHLLTLLLMNIFFWENLLLILVLFVNWRWVTGSRLSGGRPLFFHQS